MAHKHPKTTRVCGSCQHYSWTLGPQRKTTCNNLGSIDTTPSCADYEINPFVLQDFEYALKPLAEVLRVMPISTLSMFYDIIAQEKSLRRKGFYFMEKVAIKYWGTPGQQYVSNYVLAHVYSATNEGVFVIAKSGIRMFVLKESVIKLEVFLGLRRELKESGRIVDPTLSSRASNKQKLAVTETLDDIIARGCVENFEIDTEIKRKLNPKRISRGIDNGTLGSELEMSTKPKIKNHLIEHGFEEEPPKKGRGGGVGKRKVEKEELPIEKKKKSKKLDAADLFIKSKERKVMLPPVSTKKKIKPPTLFETLQKRKSGASK